MSLVLISILYFYSFIIDGEVNEYPVISIKKEEIVDTNGAGDAFVGGDLVYGHFLGDLFSHTPLSFYIIILTWVVSPLVYGLPGSLPWSFIVIPSGVCIDVFFRLLLQPLTHIVCPPI